MTWRCGEAADVQLVPDVDRLRCAVAVLGRDELGLCGPAGAVEGVAAVQQDDGVGGLGDAVAAGDVPEAGERARGVGLAASAVAMMRIPSCRARALSRRAVSPSSRSRVSANVRARTKLSG